MKLLKIANRARGEGGRGEGDLGLPVLLTDGSTQLELTAGSEQAALSQHATFSGAGPGAGRHRHPGVRREKEEGPGVGVGGVSKVTGADDVLC